MRNRLTAMAAAFALTASFAFAQGLPEPNFGVTINGLRTVPKGAPVTVHTPAGVFKGRARFKKTDGWCLGLEGENGKWYFIAENEIVCVEIQRKKVGAGK